MARIAAISRISSKGQITLPATVRKRLNLRSGDAVKYVVDGDGVRIKKADTVDIEWAKSIESTLSE